MLSTLPLFYIAQSVNSDDRRTRIQGLRVIMDGVNRNVLDMAFFSSSIAIATLTPATAIQTL